MFERSDQITILSFLSAFQMARVTNGIREGAAMCLLKFYEEARRATLTVGTCRTSSRQFRQGGKLTSQSQVVHSPLDSSVAEDIIGEGDADIISYK